MHVLQKEICADGKGLAGRQQGTVIASAQQYARFSEGEIASQGIEDIVLGMKGSNVGCHHFSAHRFPCKGTAHRLLFLSVRLANGQGLGTFF